MIVTVIYTTEAELKLSLKKNLGFNKIQTHNLFVFICEHL